MSRRSTRQDQAQPIGRRPTESTYGMRLFRLTQEMHPIDCNQCHQPSIQCPATTDRELEDIHYCAIWSLPVACA